MDAYIEKNIPTSLSVEEKLNRVGSFIASFDYNTSYQSLKSMLLHGKGGDCWASTDAAVIFCKRLGISARACSDESVSIFTGGHMYAVAYADGACYIIEAGYSGTAPRPYAVEKLPSPFISKSNYDGTCTIVNYLGNSSEIVVPEKIDGMTVSKIGLQCFYLANRYVDAGIRSVRLPDTIVSVGISAFYDCSELEYVNLPASLREIGMAAFTGCKKLALDVDAHNEYFTVKNGIVYTKDMKEIVSAYAPEKNCVIEEGVEIIQDYAFYECALDSLRFPDTLKDIGYRAFDDITLKNNAIVLPESVEGIGYGSFYTFFMDSRINITILNKDCVINNTPEEDLYLVDDGRTISFNTIYGYPGSTAQAYAEKHNRVFCSPCEAVLHTGSHNIETGNCALTAVCSSCGVTMKKSAQHKYNYSYSGYYSNTGDPYIGRVCSVCGDADTSPLYWQNLLPGDVDFDGAVTAADARLALRNSVHLSYLSGVQLHACNVDEDDTISAADARLILRRSVNLW